MPSLIYFTAALGDRALSVRVDESPAQVVRAHHAAASGDVFSLRHHRDRRVLYVNPLAIAYWIDSPDSRPERQSRAELGRAEHG